jgi:hypothetical protein
MQSTSLFAPKSKTSTHCTSDDVASEAHEAYAAVMTRIDAEEVRSSRVLRTLRELGAISDCA